MVTRAVHTPPVPRVLRGSPLATGRTNRPPVTPTAFSPPASARPALRGKPAPAAPYLPPAEKEGAGGQAAPLPSARAAAPGGGGARRPAEPLPARCHRCPATAPEPRHFRHGDNYFRCAPICIRDGAGWPAAILARARAPVWRGRPRPKWRPAVMAAGLG